MRLSFALPVEGATEDQRDLRFVVDPDPSKDNDEVDVNPSPDSDPDHGAPTPKVSLAGLSEAEKVEEVERAIRERQANPTRRAHHPTPNPD